MLTDISHRYARDHKLGDRLSFGMTQPLTVRHPARRPFVVGRAPAHERTRPAVRAHTHLGLLPLLLAIFVLLNAGDLISTYVGLQSGLREGNPLMGSLLMHYGFVALVAYKVLVVAAVSIGVLMLRRFHRGIARATVWICDALVLFVVILNVLQYAAR